MAASRHFFSPYRICPIGAHIDHQWGMITGFAIDKGVLLTCEPTQDGKVHLTSGDFPGEVSFPLNAPPTELLHDWGDFVRGAAYVLRPMQLSVGFRGHIKGSLPIGGLSSSAAVILCYLRALLALNEREVTPRELIELALRVEKDYAGVNVGRLDQSCEVLSKKDHLLFLDTMDQSYELIAPPASMRPYQLMVFYSGLSRKLGAGFNLRVDELRAAGWYLQALSGSERLPFEQTRLRDIPREVFDAHQAQLPEPFRRRARHFYTECERVVAGAQAWRSGDIERFGQLVFASGQSSIENYETGSEHLIALYEALREAPGVYGARFSGAGFKGCCIAIVDPLRTSACEGYVSERYLRQYPHLEGTYSVHLCGTADGVGC